eukprot:1001714-Amphidinium_carterae.1
MEDEFHSLKKTNDGSIRLVCFRCWNEFENTDKYSTENGKPSSAFRKKTEMLIAPTKCVRSISSIGRTRGGNWTAG